MRWCMVRGARCHDGAANNKAVVFRGQRTEGMLYIAATTFRYYGWVKQEWYARTATE